MSFSRYAVIFFICCISSAALAASPKSLNVAMYETEEKGAGPSVGQITIKSTRNGLLFTPQLHNLTPGVHGFHIHENASCEQKGMAAGAHLDPKATNKHLGPFGKGHLGDLPVIYVNADGKAALPVLAPHLHHLKELENHALMIHAGGDNYSDQPEKLGGGGSRMVCGVIKAQ